MLTSVWGHYHHGKVELSEVPPGITECDVIVTFVPAGDAGGRIRHAVGAELTGPLSTSRLPLQGGDLYTGTPEERRAKWDEFRRMLEQSAAEEAESGEDTLTELKKALDESRRAVGARLLFPDEEL